MEKQIDIRELALDILIEVNERGHYSHLVLGSVLKKYQYLTKRDRAFLTRLVEGTLERGIELDYIIDSFAQTKVKSMEPLIRNLLRLGVYQLKYMDSVPDSAICNEAVKLAKKRGFVRLSGFVNGVLRAAARGMDSVVYPDRKREPERYFCVRYSVPLWIVRRWNRAYGEEQTQRILDAMTRETLITIRTNLQRCTPEELARRLEEEGVTATPVKGIPYAFSILGFDHLAALGSFRDGWFYVQDTSSMMVAERAGVEKNSYVIDVCAAPGGKSLHMAEKLEGTGMVEARDVSADKVRLIEENIARHRLSNIRAVCMDATALDEASVEKADVVLCDLPCSGLGAMGKKKDIRYKMTPEKQKNLIALQRRILGTACAYVKPGGNLLYSTCTIDPEENEGNAAWFLKNHPEFSQEFAKQLLPGETYNDGFFLAKFVRGNG